MTENTAEKKSKTQGSRLASIDIGKDHFIEFYEHKPGFAVVIESAKLGKASVLGKHPQDKRLAELYLELTSKALDKPQHGDALKSLQEADTRISNLSPRETSALKDQAPVLPMQATPDTKAGTDAELIQTQVISSQDWERQDTEWFTNNFYWGGGPLWVNVYGFGRHYVPETYMADFVTMNASFDGWTHVVGYGKECTNYVVWTSCNYELWYERWIEPRWWCRWSYRNRLLGFRIDTDGSPLYHHAASWQ